MTELQRRVLTRDEKRVLCRLYICASFPYDLPHPEKPEDFDRTRDIIEGLKAVGYVAQMENRVGDYPILRLTPAGRALFDRLEG